ncbi:MAG: DUF2027 domain-containing protein [Bacteroidales bacterium]|nr:DUF2027 domain-containing protein [Bacteroidales bacterium]
MNFKKGDKVKFLNEDDHGTVTRVTGDGMIYVLNSDDFEVPVLARELILDPDAMPVEKKSAKPEPEPEKVTLGDRSQPRRIVLHNATPKKPKKDGVELLAAFVPADGKPLDKCDLEFYLINDSECNMCYQYLRPIVGRPGLLSAMGVLEPDTKEYIETFRRSDIGEIGNIKMQLLTYREGDTSPRKPIEAEIKVHAPKFYQETYYQDNDFFDGKAYIISVLNDSEMQEAMRTLKDGNIPHKDSQPKANAPQQRQKLSEKVVVDLHITELLDNDAGMTPKDMLDYQMKVFGEKMDEYIREPKVKKVVFIHGKGNGRLKLELRKCLDHKYKRYQYQDASFEEYGGGATLVYVK